MASELCGDEIYYDGVTYILGGEDVWDKLDPNEQARIRSKRAKAGVKCNQCGKVGYFRSNCPTCSATVKLKRDRRRQPKILPAFMSKYSREYGMWATKIMNLTRDLKTNELTRALGMSRFRRFMEDTYGDEEDKFTDRFEVWLLRSDIYGLKLEESGKLEPCDLEASLHDFHKYYTRSVR